MVYGIIGNIIRPIVSKGARQIYQALRAQDRIIDYTYRKTGLYNRGVVRGIKHGLGGGAIVGGTFQLGLNAPDTPGNDAIQTQKPKPSARTPYKTRDRRTRRWSCGYTSKPRFNQFSRRSSSSKYSRR